MINSGLISTLNKMDDIDTAMNVVADTHPLRILMNIENPESYITKKEVIEALIPSCSAM